jgi:Domain of unknown function (DUF5658)
VGVLAQFTYLQVLDILTTMAFLLQGVAESNPLVRWSMRIAPNPVSGLVLIKVAAIGLGVFCTLSSRQQLLRKVNLFFAVLVAYNLVALILASAGAS